MARYSKLQIAGNLLHTKSQEERYVTFLSPSLSSFWLFGLGEDTDGFCISLPGHDDFGRLLLLGRKRHLHASDVTPTPDLSRVRAAVN